MNVECAIKYLSRRCWHCKVISMEEVEINFLLASLRARLHVKYINVIDSHVIEYNKSPFFFLPHSGPSMLPTGCTFTLRPARSRVSIDSPAEIWDVIGVTLTASGACVCVSV